MSSFKARIRVQDEGEDVLIEVFKKVDATLIKANFIRIRVEVKALLGKGKETARPQVAGLPLKADKVDTSDTQALNF